MGASGSKTKDEFDFDDDDNDSAVGGSNRRPKGQYSLSTQPKIAKPVSRPSSLSSPASHTSDPASKGTSATPRRTPAQQKSVRAVAKGRESASHEAPASAALQRLEQNGRKAPRRGAAPAKPLSPPTPAIEAPPPKAKRRRL
jgi:hypothetical protein